MSLEGALGRVLTAGTAVAIVLLAVGVAALLVAGRSPLDPTFTPFDPAGLAADVAAGRPEGFLWLGLVAAIATPIARVGAALVGFATTGERAFAAVAAAVLAVLGTGLLLSLGAS